MSISVVMFLVILLVLGSVYLIWKALPREAKECLEDWGRSVCFHLLICSVLLVCFIFPVYLAGSRNDYNCVLLNSRHCLKLFQQLTLPERFFLSSFVSLNKGGGLGQCLSPRSYSGISWVSITRWNIFILLKQSRKCSHINKQKPLQTYTGLTKMFWVCISDVLSEYISS